MFFSYPEFEVVADQFIEQIQALVIEINHTASEEIEVDIKKPLTQDGAATDRLRNFLREDINPEARAALSTVSDFADRAGVDRCIVDVYATCWADLPLEEFRNKISALAENMGAQYLPHLDSNEVRDIGYGDISKFCYSRMVIFTD